MRVLRRFIAIQFLVFFLVELANLSIVGGALFLADLIVILVSEHLMIELHDTYRVRQLRD